MAAENAKQVFCGHLGLFFHLYVGQHVVVDEHLNDTLRQVIGVVGLVGIFRRQARQILQVGLIAHRRRIRICGDGGLEQPLYALVGTIGQTIVGAISARGEHGVD